MASVHIKEGESPESLLRRFKRACDKAGILSDIRSNEAYEKPTAKRKRKKNAARKRTKRKELRSRVQKRERSY